jgi:hypothetical protein
MALKISGTEVVNNSRALTNITGASGVYDGFHPSVSSITNALDMNKPVMTLTMSANVTFTESNKSAGRSALLILDRSAAGYTPSFSANVKWPSGGTTPVWSDHRYWNIALVCWDSTIIRASAVGFDG